MKHATALLLVVFSTSAAHTASANEIAFACNYELGGETDAARHKVGSVTVAIDVNAKTARIDFGRGWFKTMSLLVDGNEVKETGPPASGEQLGPFYFDLSEHAGGFAGETPPHEFFDSCVPTSIDVATGMPSPAATEPSPPEPVSPTKAPEPTERPAATNAPAPPASSGSATTEKDDTKRPSPKPSSAGEATIKSASRPEALEPKTVPAEANSPAPSAPSVSGQATTEYYGGKTPLDKRGFDSEPTMKSASEPKAHEPETSPAAANSPASTAPSVSAHGTTEYYGDKETPPRSASDFEVVISPEFKAQAAEPTAPPSPSPVVEDPVERCRSSLQAEAQNAKLNFANSSFVIDPGGRAKLKDIAKIIVDCGHVVVEVSGHTDNYGDPRGNKKLSQSRADAVAGILIKEGVSPSNLQAVGYGQEKPIATNATVQGRRLNRRVEFRVLGPSG